MTLCPICHSKMSLGQQLCHNCGIMLCPQCRSPLTKTKLCPKCGSLHKFDEPKLTSRPITPAGLTQSRSSTTRAYSLGPQSDKQAARQQYNCPKCSAKIDLASGRCPSCGLLLGIKHRRTPQQQPHTAQPPRPSAAPTTQSPLSQHQAKVKPESAKTATEFARLEEKESAIQAPGITPKKADEIKSIEEAGPVMRAAGITPKKVDEANATEETQPVMQSNTAMPTKVAELSATKENQIKALTTTSTKMAELPAPKRKQHIQALAATPIKVSELPVPKEKRLVMQARAATPTKAIELEAPKKREPVAQVLLATPAKTAESPSPEVRQPDKYQPILTAGGWQLPPISILDKPTEVELSQSDVEKRAQLIEEALASYGVEAKVIEINVGPTVTQFGVEPGWDRKYKEIRERDKDGNIKVRLEEVSKTRVKVDRICSLANDLALALAAPSIRIEAPVPGKSMVGIEVPNTTFGLVNLRSVIESTAFQKAYAKSKLALALGKGAGGETIAADLTRMPHLLIAGATGSGKTVCLNSIICCLLIHNTPDDVQFIMIDPKRVELVNFNSLPHLIAPVVVDTDKAVLALRWLNQEMDNRYHKFAQAGARNIEAYNKNRQPGEAMPYIVLIIDELADLMMAAFDEVEHTLCRLAQLARATGIHLIVATQRPSVDVVTGLIKANFPTRISFALTSQVDSRTILDSAGAEKLLGRGDMLYMPTDAAKPKRLQGTFISDSEIERIVYFWGNQRRPEITPVKFEDISQLTSPEKTDEDSLMDAARQLAREHKYISTSFLQRRLRIGYPRAARIMEKLEEEGYKRELANDS